MNEPQEKELLDIIRVLVILWTGTYAPVTWAYNMDRLRKFLEKYDETK